MSSTLRLRGEAVEWRIVDGEVMVLDLRTSTYFAVNGAGAVIWPELADGTTTGDLEARLAEAFDLSPELARRDVGAFVASLRAQGLLET